MLNHVCFFSSGKASWVAAYKVALKYPNATVWLVFADTGIEDEDNYRFLIESFNWFTVQFPNVHCIWLKDGRTPWDIYHGKKYLSHRVNSCSIELKVKPCQTFLQERGLLANTTRLYFGIGYEELHRITAIKKNWSPYQCGFPLLWNPVLDSAGITDTVSEFIPPPRLYAKGFAHANCGGFCPKAGKKHFANLLKHFPDRYAHHEQKELDFWASIGRQHNGILRKQTGGQTHYITLRDWRLALTEGGAQRG